MYGPGKLIVLICSSELDPALCGYQVDWEKPHPAGSSIHRKDSIQSSYSAYIRRRVKNWLMVGRRMASVSNPYADSLTIEVGEDKLVRGPDYELRKTRDGEKELKAVLSQP